MCPPGAFAGAEAWLDDTMVQIFKAKHSYYLAHKLAVFLDVFCFHEISHNCRQYLILIKLISPGGHGRLHIRLMVIDNACLLFTRL